MNGNYRLLRVTDWTSMDTVIKDLRNVTALNATCRAWVITHREVVAQPAEPGSVERNTF